MIIALTFFLGLKHFTLSSASFAMSSNPIDVRDVDDPAPGLGPRSYNSCMLFRMRSCASSRRRIVAVVVVSRLGRVARASSRRFSRRFRPTHVRRHRQRAGIVRGAHSLRFARAHARRARVRASSSAVARVVSSQPLVGGTR